MHRRFILKKILPSKFDSARSQVKQLTVIESLAESSWTFLAMPIPFIYRTDNRALYASVRE
jgi:hypothetical protein